MGAKSSANIYPWELKEVDGAGHAGDLLAFMLARLGVIAR